MKPKKPPRRRNRSIVYFVLALAVFLSPVALTHYKNVEQHNLAAEYSENIALMPAEYVDPVLEDAHAYNQGLVDFPVSDPWKYGVDTNSQAYRDYEEHLNVDGLMARIEIPSVGVDLPVSTECVPWPPTGKSVPNKCPTPAAKTSVDVP